MNIAVANLERALLSLDHTAAKKIIHNSLSGDSRAASAGNLISSALKNIGELWESDELSLSQVYTSGLICEQIIEQSFLQKSPKITNQPKIAIGVLNDFHALGKRIIYLTLRASGYNLIDLGTGLSVEQLIQFVEKENIKVLMISVLMLPSALRIAELTKQLKLQNVTIVVGGAPFRFDPNLYKEVGADFHGNDSAEALDILTQIMDQKQW